MVYYSTISKIIQIKQINIVRMRVAKELIVALRKILVIDARLFESCRGVTRVFS